MRPASLGLVLLTVLGAPTSSQERIGGPFAVRDLEPRQQRVWIVDEDGTGDFTQLQPAIDAAASGDVVLVRSDLFLPLGESLHIEGKGLSIVGLGATRRSIHITGVMGFEHQANLSVGNVPEGEHVVLRNLFVIGNHLDTPTGPPPTLPVIGLFSNEGTVWFEDCRLGSSRQLSTDPDERDGISARDCAAVILVRCALDDLRNTSLTFFGVRASLRATRSAVHAFDSLLLGANGFKVGAGNPTPGGDAVVLVDSFLFASGSQIRGGAGGNAFCGLGCLPGEDGGLGLFIDVDSEAHLLDTSLDGGPGGGSCTPCPGGDPGMALVGDGPFEGLDGTARSYELSSPTTEGGNATLIASGPVGDLVLSLIGHATTATYLPQHLGTQLTAPTVAIVTEGVIPASGVLSKTVAMPLVPPPMGFVETFRQGFFFESGGDAFLASGSAVLTLGQ